MIYYLKFLFNILTSCSLFILLKCKSSDIYSIFSFVSCLQNRDFKVLPGLHSMGNGHLNKIQIRFEKFFLPNL